MALEIFKLMGSVFVDTEKADKSLSKTEKHAGSLGEKFVAGAKTVGKFGAGLATAAAAGGAAMLGVAKKTASVTDNIDKMSQRLGLSRKAYQELDFALSQSGVDINSFQTGMKSLLKNMDAMNEGNETATANFKKLGVSVTNSDGTLRNQEEVLFDTISAFQGMKDSADKSRLAQELFGKQGQEIIPLLNSQSGSIEEMRKQANDLGLVLSDDTVDAGVKFTDTMDQLERSFQAVVVNVGGAVIPVIQEFANWIISNMPLIRSILGNVFGFISTYVTGFSNVLMQLLTIAKGTFVQIFEIIQGNSENIVATGNDIFSKIKNGFNQFVSALQQIWVQIGQPLFGTIQQIALIVKDAFVQNFDSIKLVVKVCFDILKTAYNTVAKPTFDIIISIVNKVLAVFKSNMPAMSALFKSMASTISNLWNNGLKPVFNAIKSLLENVVKPVFDKVFDNGIKPVVEQTFKSITSFWNNGLKPTLEGITKFIGGVFSGDWKKAFEGLGDIVSGVFNGLVEGIKAPLNAIIRLFNNSFGKINIKIPDWIPVAGGAEFKFPTLNYLAKGGNVYDSGKAVVGEAGAELVDLPTGAKVTPLTNNGDPIGYEKMAKVLTAILVEMKSLNESLYNKMVDAMVNGVSFEMNDREFGRMVKKFA